MVYRFHQAEGIANRLTLDATHKLAACVQGEVSGDDLRLVIFNPLPRPLDEVSVLEIEVPVEWPGAGSEMGGYDFRPGLRLFDALGQPLDYQRLGQSLNQPRFRVYDTAFPRAYKVHVLRVAVRLRIPALGYTTLAALPGEHGMPSASPLTAPSIVSGHRCLSNEFLTVTLDTNGTLSVLDRRNGNAYRGLLTFEDTADAGDGWNYAPVSNDFAALSSACHADVALVSNGPLLGAFRVRVKMELPAEFDFASMTRSMRVEPLVIESLVSLRAGAEQVDVETTVHNTVCDHRLRVLFPSNAARAITYLADTPFDVVERSIALRLDNHLYREPEIETKPQQNWTAVFDDQRGLAVVSPGQLETGIIDTPERTLALTLFRATRHTVFTAGEPGGQLLGDLKFKYAIVPLSGAPNRAALFSAANLLAAGLQSAQLRPADVRNLSDSLARDQRSPARLPLEGSFVALDGPVVLTSLRRTAAGLELRLFNPENGPAAAALQLAGWPASSPRPASAAWVNLESHPLGEPFALPGERFDFTVGPKEIKTLCLM
jgi:alpha-mannosidase/mannosylglycerate hydrolase